MAYSPALTTEVDRIRFGVQDIDDAAPLLPEATYTALYALYDDSEARATLAAAEALLLRYSGEPNKVEVVGAVKVEWTERLKFWAALVNRLRAELGLVPLGATDTTMRVARFVRTAESGSEFGG